MRARFPLFLPEMIVVHHSASRRRTTFAEVEHWHTDPRPRGRGWPAPGYNLGINAAGRRRVWRDVPQRGSAVAAANTGKINVLLMGDNTKPAQRWNQHQVHVLHEYYEACCIVWPHLRGQIFGHTDVTVPGHGSVCPGLDIATLVRLDWSVERYWNENG